MTDAEFEKQCDRIRKLVKLYHNALGFRWFELNHVYQRTVNDENGDVCAQTSFAWQYIRAEITWFMPIVATQSDDELRSIYFHEHGHVLTAPMAQWLVDDNEGVVNHIKEYTTELVERALEYAVDYEDNAKSKKSNVPARRKVVSRKATKG